ncbi:hypothetical protein GCM10010250_22160 [Streptomyces althioticus]|uniref:phage minor head protein n=1 Tax=Streptomyces althioticus TaxID=83380 RepID=UPI001873DB05|nr:hypothetical protein GCM10010250_22160 [Streptomyces althioticus]
MDDELLTLLEAAEDDVSEEVAAVLQEVADEFARELADATEIVAARFSVSRIARMWASRMPRIVRRLLRVSEQAAEHTAEAVDGELPPEWEDLPGRNDDGRQLPPVMREYVEVTEHLLNAVGDRLAEAAREELAAGVDAGEDMEQLRARLRERFAREGAQLGEAREERIARTEAGRAWNYAVLGAARDATGADRPLVKQWLTRRDTRVREDHAAANGQTRLLDEDFTVGGVQMAAPHDPDAPASQVVNCRCFLVVHPETAVAAYGSQVASPAAVEKSRDNRMTTAEPDTFHGTPGRPSYRRYHPKGKGGGGKTRTPGGAMLGSSRFSEDQHRTALRNYRATSYEDMNSSLRHGVLPDAERSRQRIRDDISTLSDLINVQEPTSEGKTFFRRMENHRLSMQPGDEFHDKGFVSMSAREDVLSIQIAPDDPNYTMFKISMPKGAQVLDVDAVGVGGFGADEQEFIAPPGTAFRVKRVIDEGSDTRPPYYELEVTNAVAASAGVLIHQPTTTVTAADESSDLAQRITWGRDDIVIDKRASAVTAAGGHTGAMIALMPAAADATHLALDDGEPADELHLTLWFLGDAADWSAGQRRELVDQVRKRAAGLAGPVRANAFGINHWNPASEDPAWVYAIGDDHDSGDAVTLQQARDVLAAEALEGTSNRPATPHQHAPWVAHTTAAYANDPWPFQPMQERLGPVTYDRVRVAFGGEHTDIPLGVVMPASLQAAASRTVRTWSTPDDAAIAFENEETGDGRIFKKGALKWDRRPMPLQYADEMLMGHQGAQLAGAIKKVKREGGRITASGVLYRTQPAGLDAEVLLDEDDPVLGISVDLDDVGLQLVDKSLTEEDADWLFASAKLPQASVMRMEDGSVMLSASTRAEWTASDGAFSRSRYDLQVITGPGGVLTAAAVREAFAGTGVLTAAAGDPDSTDGLVLHEQKSGELLMRITSARLRGATLVAMPAFKNARIVLDPPNEEETAAAVPVITAAGETRDRVVTYVCTSPAAVGARDVSRAVGIAMSTARGHLNAAAKDGQIVRLAPGLFCGPSSMPEGHEETAVEPVTAAGGVPDVDDELTASFWREMQDLPPMPAEWFREPTTEELPPGSEGVHVAGGRIYGWVAQSGVPHAGYPGKNLTIDKLAKQGLDLTHFLRSRFALDDGSVVKCGVITMNVGHHRDGAECETDACLFDDTRTVAGIVTVGMSEGGMWFAGAANPKMSDWDRSVFKGCQPSYHLRQGPSGKWELRAVLSVPTPGHSSALLVAAVVERTNLALAASAAAVDVASGQDPDTARTASASSTDTPPEQPGHSPDTASGQLPQVDVEALAAALAGGPLVDLLADAVTRRQDERRAEIEAMAALVAEQPVTVTASAQNGAN